MITVISPAKSLDFSPIDIQQYTEVQFPADTQELAAKLADHSPSDLMELMSISEKLATLNYERFQEFKIPHTAENAKQALFAYDGDVYTGFQLDQYSEEELGFAQNHLRIISGLYGILRPLDLIQPYRLEMKIKLQNERGKDLYTFWGNQLTESLNQSFEQDPSKTLINLASKEYFKAIRPTSLNANIISPTFKEIRNGKAKIIALFAKKARGMMSDYIIRHQINQPEDLKYFQEAGYQYDQSLSNDNEWVFIREQA